MYTLDLETLNIKNLNAGGSLVFSQTTASICREQIQKLKDLGQNKIDKYIFLSVGFSTKYKVNTRKGVIEYQVLKQKDQYKFIIDKIMGHEFSTFDVDDGVGFLFFEQTFEGNIHFHGILKTECKQDLKADFLDCFNIKRGSDAKFTVNIKPITNLEGLEEYCFQKTTKKYEIVDQQLFKPLKITSSIMLENEEPIGARHQETTERA